MNTKELNSIINGSIRIPLNYRVSKENAVSLLELIREEITNESAISPQVYALAAWTGKSIGDFIPDQKFSETISVIYHNQEKTMDLHVPDGNSYIGNGIICHNTINLPNDVSVEKVGEIYMRSWEMGLKGITVYRDGSRSGVLVSNKEEKKSTYGESNAPKRPKTLECDVIRFTNDGKRWIGFVGLYEGRPYEIFTGKADDMKIPTSVEVGRIRKVKTDKGSRYDFVYTDKDGKEVVEDWLNKTFDKHYWNTAKMISGILRHGMPLPYVVDLVSSLNLDGDVITTWKNGVARMIKRYIPDGTTATDKKCKDCGADSVIYQEGCLLCTQCGSSRCGG